MKRKRSLSAGFSIRGLGLAALLVSTPAFAGPVGWVTVSDAAHGFAFDYPDRWSYRRFPSIPGGAFAPRERVQAPLGFERMSVEVKTDYAQSPTLEAFLAEHAVLSCAADGPDGSQYCREGSVMVRPFTGALHEGFVVHRVVVEESWAEDRDGVSEREDRFYAFPLPRGAGGEWVIAVFSAEEEGLLPEIEAIARTFRREGSGPR